MRIESSVTAISWIPSEAITGPTKASFAIGVSHYDSAPPDQLGPDVAANIEALRAGDRLRFANHLRAFIDVDDDGRIVDAGYTGGGTIGATTIRVGKSVTVAAVSLPDRQTEPEVGDGWVRFTQTCGGRTGLPMPRTVKHPPFVQYFSPVAHSTLELTIRTDGTSGGRLVGASAYPRHWVYDDGGTLLTKTARVDYRRWAGNEYGKRTPWGDVDSPAFTTAVETALERELSQLIMGGGKPEIRKLAEGDDLVRFGDPGDELYLLLDGVLVVIVHDTELVELGPGAVVGERAVLEGGTRRATLRAVTPCRIAAVPGDSVDRQRLVELSAGHRREEQVASG